MVSWENLTKSEEKVGIGFKDLNLLNIALLANNAGRLSIIQMQCGWGY